jgi:hypothetical protein
LLIRGKTGENGGKRVSLIRALFHVAVAAGRVAVDAVQNLHGGFAVDGAQIGAGFRRPPAWD